MVRVERIELSSQPWEGCILTTIRYPRVIVVYPQPCKLACMVERRSRTRTVCQTKSNVFVWLQFDAYSDMEPPVGISRLRAYNFVAYSEQAPPAGGCVSSLLSTAFAEAKDPVQSRQLSWSHLPGSNRRPARYECAALPTELRWQL